MLTLINKRVLCPSRLVPFAAAFVLPLAAALAQTSLPDEMIRKNEISPSDRQQMKALIDANKAGLSGTPSEIKKSREVLVAPLEKDGVSVQFRVACASALLESGGLAGLAAHKDNDLIATNALRIAGQSATGNTMRLVLDALKDPRPQVRYAATVAARAAFTAARTNSALAPDELSRAMRALSDTVVQDAAPQPVDGAIQALVAARDVPNNRSTAIERLTDAAGRKALALAKGSDPFDLAPFLRASGPLQQDIIEGDKLPVETRRTIAVFAAQILIAVDAQWRDGDPDAITVQTAKAANSLLSLAMQQISRQSSPLALGDLVAPGKKQQFQEALAKLVGPGGTLQSAPYSLPADKLKP